VFYVCYVFSLKRNIKFVNRRKLAIVVFLSNSLGLLFVSLRISTTTISPSPFSPRYLPNYFSKHQLTKMFFCFPDPHFKAKNHRRRIITDTLLTEYAFVLKPGGRLYCITDVEELHGWHMSKLRAHPCFVEIDPVTAEAEDPAVDAMINTTEEGKKVARAGNNKYWGVFQRLSDEEIAAKNDALFE
jgi:hypothetical protein